MNPPKPIPPISDRQKQRNKEYAKAIRQWWQGALEMKPHYSSVPLCQVAGCEKPAQKKPHHKYGRIGPLYWWIPGFMAVCRSCHRDIHNKPAWAISQGYLAPMGQWNNTKLCMTENPATNT